MKSINNATKSFNIPTETYKHITSRPEDQISLSAGAILDGAKCFVTQDKIACVKTAGRIYIKVLNSGLSEHMRQQILDDPYWKHMPKDDFEKAMEYTSRYHFPQLPKTSSNTTTNALKGAFFGGLAGLFTAGPAGLVVGAITGAIGGGVSTSVSANIN